ncbi:MotA/TolQ/ExbB proton channel family protein [Bergeyella zoohelcum]|uniref:MotA/TolQ/ExbB proton channel family protein n=1 Tax=Bergeyella zoohelcum TaxID=1015 RepID=UPI002A914A42|nr:MotA/TolQ/ExbB proton channel family protein [Bergeyella zoohelcum]MDY6025455.1 MotA/TolQ/ExbB proton channel family protein [Bergeyella zoohelcum]
MLLQVDSTAAVNAVKDTASEVSFSFWDIMFHGNLFANIVMIAVLLLGMFSLYIFIERFLYIKRHLKIVDKNLVDNVNDFLAEGNIQKAIDYCERQDTPESRVLSKGVSRVGRPLQDILSAMENQSQIEVAKQEKNLNLLAAMPSLAPMLGLLGTVIGIIMAFFNMSTAEGTVSPKTLSTGIYTALGHTAMGLAVAIPANFFYNLLLTQIDKFVLKMQNLSADFLDIINKP